jgi:phosphoglycolate phosphatase-like HAD superfamily hydrolase
MIIKNIIWDFDGTIMDTYPAITGSAHSVAKLNNVALSYAETQRMCKITLREALEYISDHSSKSYEELFQEYLQEYDKFDLSSLILFPFVKDVLELIIQNGGNNYIITHRGKESLIQHLNEKNIASLFSYLISGDCNFKRKPEADAFLFLKDKFKLSPDNTVVMGDRLLDVQAGYAAGFSGMLYQNNSDFPGKITDITDYSELLELIKRNA